MSRQNKIGKHCTTVQTKDGYITVTYHETDVVKFDGTMIVLDTGGWYTDTTRRRMNQASQQFSLGYSVYAIKGQWRVKFGNVERLFDADDRVILLR